MERPHPLLTIRTRRHVWVGVFGITLVVLVATWFPIAVATLYFTRSIAVAAILCAQVSVFPIFITPPIAWFGLSVARLLTQTIDRVDNLIRNDPLTGALTRAYLLGQTREAAARGGAFLMIDADYFKAINDTYGHDVGDAALKRIAELLASALPPDALFGRLGGEEFGVFLPGVTEEEAAFVAESLCDVIRAGGREAGGQVLNMTVSIGGSQYRAGESLDKTIKRADEALYHAKRSGRDRFYISDATDTMPGLVLRSKIGA
jgi:diguanylate cyclase (GGDEF)-like protein